MLEVADLEVQVKKYGFGRAGSVMRVWRSESE